MVKICLSRIEKRAPDGLARKDRPENEEKRVPRQERCEPRRERCIMKSYPVGEKGFRRSEVMKLGNMRFLN